MSGVVTVGTYLPAFGSAAGRVAGPDEDALTLAVAAGVAALGAREDLPAVERVVLVTRDLPLVEGGSTGPLLAGLGLPAATSVAEVLGGAPAVLDAVSAGPAGTLVIGVDLAPAGAGAVLVGPGGVNVELVGRFTGSLPMRARGRDGIVWEYDDPRLGLERGAKKAIAALDLSEPPNIVAGVAARQARTLTDGRGVELPTTGASAAVFALASAGAGDVVLGVEQASACAVAVGGPPVVQHDESAPSPLPRTRLTPGPDIGISLPAYERAFEAKVRWEGGSCDECGHVAMPPRLRCTECGSEDGWTLVPLPRTGEVYTQVAIHIPVPGKETPYSLAILSLDGTAVRALVTVTGPRSTVAIGDRGRLVLRKVADRSGIPDYGYALLLDEPAADEKVAS